MNQEPNLDALLKEADPAESPINMGDYLRRAWQRKWVIIIPAILFTLLGFLYWTKLAVRRFESTALLLETLPRATAEVIGEESNKFTRTERDTFYATVYRMRARVANSKEMKTLWKDQGMLDPNRQPGLLQKIGMAFGQAALKPEENEAEQQKGLKARLQSKPSDTARIFELSFESPDKRQAQRVIETATSLFKKYYNSEIASVAEQTQKLMTRQANAISFDLAEVLSEITSFQVANPGVDPKLIESTTDRYQAELENLTTLRSEFSEIESNLRTLKFRLIATPVFASDSEDSPLVLKLEEQEEKLALLLSQNLTRKHPQVIPLLNAIAKTKRKIKEEEDSRDQDTELNQPERDDPKVIAEAALRDNRRLMRAELDLLMKRRQSLHKLRGRLQEDFQTNPRLTPEDKKKIQVQFFDINTEIVDNTHLARNKEEVLDALAVGSDLAILRQRYGDSPMKEIRLKDLPEDGVVFDAGLLGGPRRLHHFSKEELTRLSKDYLALASDREGLIQKMMRKMHAMDLGSENLRQVKDRLDRFAEKSGKLETLRKREDDLRNRLEFVEERRIAVMIKSALERENLGRRLVVLQEATLPGEPSWPPPWFLVLPVSLLLGVGFGVMIIVVLELNDHSFWRSDTVEHHLNQPVLATIPMTDVDSLHLPQESILFGQTAAEQEMAEGRGKTKFSARVLRRLRRRTMAAEQFRKLRLKLATGFPEVGSPRTLLITSSIPEEGKTLVAANLAAAISRRIGEHVLLVDCDLRRPAVHRSFGLENSAGLSEYLEGQAELPELLRKTEYETLSVLTAGAGSANPGELLGSERMRNLVAELRSRYADRIIIFDSPPVLATADPTVLAEQVDGTLMVIEAGRTPREVVDRALAALADHRVFGIILNAAKYEITSHFFPSEAR